MPELDHNPELLLSAFLRIARAKASPEPWLTSLQAIAFVGTTEHLGDVLEKVQDPFASTVATEGSSTGWLRECSCLVVAQLCEAALRVIEAEEEQAEAGFGSGPVMTIHGADFSQRPCTLG